MIDIIKLQSVPSTNSWIKENNTNLSAPCAVRAIEQTAGRGQRGNVWLSAPEKNLLFSLLWRPAELKAINQFALSQAVTIAVCRTLTQIFSIEAKIKWPNDIYVGDKKIAGILIEHSLKGSMIDYSIIGIGLNVNQTEFPGTLPNPTSTRIVTGKTEATDFVLTTLLKHLEAILPDAESAEGRSDIHKIFMSLLWRNDGKLHPFIDRTVGAEAARFSENPDGPGAPHAFPMMATIEAVAPTGHLHLRDADGILRVFAFKEVEFVI